MAAVCHPGPCPDVMCRAGAGSRGCLHLVQSPLRGRQHGGDQTAEAMTSRDAWSYRSRGASA